MNDDTKGTDGKSVGSNDWLGEAKGLLNFLESDFCQSGREVRIEAIRCELEAAFDAGKNGGEQTTGACWICGKHGPDTAIVVERETPNGTPCSPRSVRVHFGCLMDIDA